MHTEERFKEGVFSARALFVVCGDYPPSHNLTKIDLRPKIKTNSLFLHLWTWTVAMPCSQNTEKSNTACEKTPELIMFPACCSTDLWRKDRCCARMMMQWHKCMLGKESSRETAAKHFLPASYKATGELQETRERSTDYLCALLT